MLQCIVVFTLGNYMGNFTCIPEPQITDIFAYFLRAHIRNINMRMYITSASGHECRRPIHAHIIMHAWAEYAYLSSPYTFQLSGTPLLYRFLLTTT